MSNVPYQEEVRPGELRHALRGYSALGYPPTGYTPTGNGNIIIIIMAPPQTAIPDWRNGAFQPHAAPRRQTALPLNVGVAGAIMAVAAVGYLAYALLGGRDALPATVPDGYRDLWGGIIDGIGIMVVVFIFMLAAWLLRAVGPQFAALLKKGGKR